MFKRMHAISVHCIFICLTVFIGINSKPTGAPCSAIEEMEPKHGVYNAAKKSNPFSLYVKNTHTENGKPCYRKNKVSVTIANNNLAAIKGFSLQARIMGFLERRTGSFEFENEHIRLHCDEPAAVTHVNAEEATQSELQVLWNPSLFESIQGVVFKATVAEKFNLWYTITKELAYCKKDPVAPATQPPLPTKHKKHSTVKPSDKLSADSGTIPYYLSNAVTHNTSIRSHKTKTTIISLTENPEDVAFYTFYVDKKRTFKNVTSDIVVYKINLERIDIVDYTTPLNFASTMNQTIGSELNSSKDLANCQFNTTGENNCTFTVTNCTTDDTGTNCASFITPTTMLNQTFNFTSQSATNKTNAQYSIPTFVVLKNGIAEMTNSFIAFPNPENCRKCLLKVDNNGNLEMQNSGITFINTFGQKNFVPQLVVGGKLFLNNASILFNHDDAEIFVGKTVSVSITNASPQFGDNISFTEGGNHTFQAGCDFQVPMYSGVAKFVGSNTYFGRQSTFRISNTLMITSGLNTSGNYGLYLGMQSSVNLIDLKIPKGSHLKMEDMSSLFIRPTLILMENSSLTVNKNKTFKATSRDVIVKGGIKIGRNAHCMVNNDVILVENIPQESDQLNNNMLLLEGDYFDGNVSCVNNGICLGDSDCLNGGKCINEACNCTNLFHGIQCQINYKNLTYSDDVIVYTRHSNIFIAKEDNTTSSKDKYVVLMGNKSANQPYFAVEAGGYLLLEDSKITIYPRLVAVNFNNQPDFFAKSYVKIENRGTLLLKQSSLTLSKAPHSILLIEGILNLREKSEMLIKSTSSPTTIGKGAEVALVNSKFIMFQYLHRAAESIKFHGGSHKFTSAVVKVGSVYDQGYMRSWGAILILRGVSVLKENSSFCITNSKFNPTVSAAVTLHLEEYGKLILQNTSIIHTHYNTTIAIGKHSMVKLINAVIIIQENSRIEIGENVTLKLENICEKCKFVFLIYAKTRCTVQKTIGISGDGPNPKNPIMISLQGADPKPMSKLYKFYRDLQFRRIGSYFDSIECQLNY